MTAWRSRCGPGVPVSDIEFIQFHPTMLFDGHAGGRRPLITEALRGEGAILVDAQGEFGHRRRTSDGRPGSARRGGRGHRCPAERDRRPLCLPRRPRHRRLRATIPHRHRGVPGGRYRSHPPTDPGGARARTTAAVVSSPTCTAVPICPGCSRPARWRAPACTAPTGWRPTACSKAWWSAAGPARPPPSMPPRPAPAARGCPSRRPAARCLAVDLQRAMTRGCVGGPRRRGPASRLGQVLDAATPRDIDSRADFEDVALTADRGRCRRRCAGTHRNPRMPSSLRLSRNRPGAGAQPRAGRGLLLMQLSDDELTEARATISRALDEDLRYGPTSPRWPPCPPMPPRARRWSPANRA